MSIRICSTSRPVRVLISRAFTSPGRNSQFFSSVSMSRGLGIGNPLPEAEAGIVTRGLDYTSQVLAPGGSIFG